MSSPSRAAREAANNYRDMLDKQGINILIEYRVALAAIIDEALKEERQAAEGMAGAIERFFSCSCTTYRNEVDNAGQPYEMADMSLPREDWDGLASGVCIAAYRKARGEG